MDDLKQDNQDTKRVPAEALRAAGLAPAYGSAEHRAQLWDAINDYAEACGATPGERIYGNTKRQRAVTEIEALVYPPNAEVSDRRTHGNENTTGANGGSLH